MKAYPQEGQIEYRLIGNNWVVDKDQGMDLRDYFAAHALQVFLGQGSFNHPDAAAQSAYEYADAMMKARTK